jgi:hypothetical protein
MKPILLKLDDALHRLYQMQPTGFDGPVSLLVGNRNSSEFHFVWASVC